ncbi:hypothetical protein A3D03_06685 [Candidatus Gottesmanbacteria bacterium RIFCSPHIGHO2_02_FULL_40_13]|uniref:DUF676 domain-containing protein n=1 Tax=Candidatus Gottesmanbacteria bacterium RIFCSPHIGHO2_02_FULL_40_13 TaxID=1798384 RepID=A0A1F6ACD3_9BACT|nr:MAG: hypothetical protein A3D03_06685 [Candidatus Gottesmanbacteria bacterium RIFCSPHIGHO2_02_FULL_40_13]
MFKYRLLIVLLLLSIFYLYSPSSVFSIWFKIDHPVLPVGSSSQWDSKIAGAPSVLLENGKYRMWYEGSDGGKWVIGYAESIDGIIWDKQPSYLLSGFDTSTNFNLNDPNVIKFNNKYYMWFGSSTRSLNNFHINFTLSNDGFIWNQPTFNILPEKNSWEFGLGTSFPFVLYDKGIYKMWFASQGVLNNIDKWRLGYAESEDNIIWHKKASPFLESLPSEGVDLGRPYILKENGIYHLWYHSDKNIYHAYSYDGINFIRDKDNPVLKPGPQQFDNLRVTTPFVLHVDNKYYMFYTGMSTDGKWQIGLATSDDPGFIPDTPTPGPVTMTPTPTATPTVTISPTPTSSPTPEYTPTPTIDPKTAPIILIPGMGASWNSRALYSCNITDSNDNKWKMTPFVSIYKRLINTLTKNAKLKLNKDLFIYNYDWRQPLDTQADNLKKYLDSIIKSNSSVKKFRLVGHSLGGLVIRSYLERYNTDNNVIQALTIGTPHQGTLLAYPLWENGEIWSEDLTSKIALSQILEFCKLNKTDLRSSFKTGRVSYPSKKDLIRSLIPSIQSLLPTFDYLYQNGKVKKTDSLTHQNDWLPKNLFPENRYHIKFDTLSGTGQSTLSNFVVSNPSTSDLAKDIWADGKPMKNNFVNAGDGTVLISSSRLDGADNETVTGDHLKIVSSKEGIQKILHFLQYDEVKVADALDLPEISSDNAIIISTDLSTHIILTDLSGKVLERGDNILVRYNPRVGVYKFSIIPAESGEAVLDTMFIGQTKEYINTVEKIRLIKNVRKTFLLTYLGKNTDSIRIIPYR